MLASIAPQAALEEENSICVALGAGVGAGVLVSRYFGIPNYVKMKTVVTAAGQTIVSPKTASTLLFLLLRIYFVLCFLLNLRLVIFIVLPVLSVS